MSHKPCKTSRNKANRQARHARKIAKRRMYAGLTADPRKGFRFRGK